MCFIEDTAQWKTFTTGFAKQYDFWINDTIDVSSLNILGPKKVFCGNIQDPL